MAHDPSWRGGNGSPDRRRTPRRRMAVGCTFARRGGSTVSGRTIDLGLAGMCVATTRPLSVDEVLSFELPADSDGPVMGQARVMREQTFGVYAMRFERLPGAAQANLQALCDTGTSEVPNGGPTRGAAS